MTLMPSAWFAKKERPAKNWELKRWVQNQQKNAADQYGNRAIALMSSAQEAASFDALEEIWRDLLAILQIAMDVTRDRRLILASAGRAAVAGS